MLGITTIKKKINLFLFIFLIFGCSKSPSLDKADHFSRLAKDYYEKAVREYQRLIDKGKQNEEVYFKLGKLYFEHGEYPLAIEAFKKIKTTEAKKYLAISYYKLADFTSALKIFDELGALEDDFYLYYYALCCEALNLYPQAKSIYNRIKSQPYLNLAKQNLEKIEYSFKEVEEDLKRFFDKKFSKEFYPEASVLFLLVDENVELQGENFSIYTGHFIIKILDERGKENFSEVVINYDSTYEKPFLEFARTIKEDGSSVYVGKKHIRDVSRYLDFPLYSNARSLILSMPEITVGSIIEYKFKIFKNQLIDKKHFSLSYSLQEDEPILEANFSVSVPLDTNLNIKILNDIYNPLGKDLSPSILKEKDRIKYIWHFENIPQIISEPNMPPYTEINPLIIASTFSSWNQIYNWWWRLAKDKIKVTAPIKEMVEKLVKDAKTDEEKARLIYEFCARNIRYVAVAYGQAGYEPHQAEEIFLNKYGDCKDQSILLVTMLRQAGLKAYPVLIGTRDYFNLYPDFPSVLFNHCIAMVELEGKSIFLDPTCSTCSFGDLPLDDQERKVLVFKDEGFEIKETPSFSHLHNKIKHSLKINLKADGKLEAEKEVVSSGLFNQVQRAWFLYTQPEMIRQILEEKIQEICIGGKLEGYSVENLEDFRKSVILRYKFKGPFNWVNMDNLRIIPQLADLAIDLVAKEKRNYPLEFDLLITEEREIIFELPEGFRVEYLPKDIHMDSKWMEFFVEYRTQGRNIYFKQTKIIKERKIELKDYHLFREFYQELLKRINQRIVLKKIR